MISYTILSEIVVLWRQPDTMALWGIPYDMRPGQSPRDLYEGRKVPDTLAAARGWYGRTIPSPGPREGWIWLGSPGWWGNLDQRSQDTISSWLDGVTAGNRLDLPQGPAEWILVSDLALKQARGYVEPIHGEEPDDE